MQRVLNQRKAAPDARDKVYRATKPITIPRAFSMEEHAPPVRDQGEAGCCGGFTAAEVYYGGRRLEGLRNPGFRLRSSFGMVFSPNDVYWRTRARMGDTRHDTGVDNRALAMTLVHDGICPEALRPYSDNDWKTAPTVVQNLAAETYKMGAFHFVTSSRDACEVLASGFPLIVGVNLYSSFMDDTTAKTGDVPMPKRGESIEGGHDMSAWGYDLDHKVHGKTVPSLKLLNHWGAEWGCEGGPAGRQERGWCWFPLELLDRCQMDMVVTHFGRPWGAQ